MNFRPVLLIPLLLMACISAPVRAETWYGIYMGATCGDVYVLHYYMDESGVMHGIASTIKLYVDGNYIGSWAIPASGANIGIPETYTTPGYHTVRAVYDGSDYPYSESSIGYTCGGSGAEESLDRQHILINSTVSSHESATWVSNISDFNGYWLMFNNATIINYRQWWEFETINDLYIKLSITTASGSALAVTRLHGSTGFFGLMNTFHVSVGASNGSSWDQVTLVVPPFYSYGTEFYGWNPEEFQLYVVPEANQTRFVWLWNINGKNVAHTVELPVVLDGSATVTLSYEYEGEGYIEGYVSDSFTLPSLPPYEGFKGGVAGWLSEIIGIDLSQALAVLLDIIGLFFAVVKLTIPLLGAIVFFWVMDTIFTAITTEEVRLIGDMFLTIYDFAVAIWHAIAAIIQAIWDMITFWS